MCGGRGGWGRGKVKGGEGRLKILYDLVDVFMII